MDFIDGLRVEDLAPVRIKAELLSSGVSLSPSFIEQYGPPFLEKRRAYGNSDDLIYQNVTVPQELYLGPSKVVCSVNIRSASEWILDFDGDYIVRNKLRRGALPVTFPYRPCFYEENLKNGARANSIATLYGGGALGVFVYGSCALVQENLACQYCSIQANRLKQTEFEEVVRPVQIYEVVKAALVADGDLITQVMINGGNFKDSDKSFKYYIEICAQARAALDELGSNAELHLIAYPPADFSLFVELAKFDVSLAMNSEVFDPVIFKKVCPGKDQQYLRSALFEAVKVFGRGKVYSILVGGLEPLDSLRRGMMALANGGVTPIINVFHPDPGTPLEHHCAPTVADIMEMGALLQDVYSLHDFMTPFYSGCGRNAIDTEAYLKLFKEIK